MNNILVSGLITIETTAKIEQFPIEYSPIDFKFYGVNSTISGVGYNIIKAIKTLGGNPALFSIIGNDIYKNIIKEELKNIGINNEYVLPIINETSQSVILYNENNRRKIILDLKNLQETKYPVNKIGEIINDIDIAVLCNINFSRDLLKIIKRHGKTIATDVHVVYDIIVIGLGENGVLIYTRENNQIKYYPAVRTREIINTIGAGDALFSAFIYFYNKTKDAYYAIEKAIIFASYKIGEKGAAEGFLTEEELLKIK
ncbi:hypothetical protein AGMMS49546_36800 [Spirochaetia bacterium]|nr:hypothetical protein AGMMS49546_36800 [Spirochaetia bacterium]